MNATVCPEAERTLSSLSGLITNLRERIAELNRLGYHQGQALDYLHDRIDALETARDVVRVNFGMVSE